MVYSIASTNTQYVFQHFENASATPASFNTLVENYNFLNPPLVYGFVVLAALWFTSPLWLSILASRWHRDPENIRVVPPFAICLFSIAYGIALVVPGYLPPVSPLQSQINEFTIVTAFIPFVFFGMAAWGSDSIAVSLIGRSAPDDCIWFEELRIDAGIDEVKSRLTRPDIQRNLFLSVRIEGDKQSGYLMRTLGRPDRYYDRKVRLRLSENEDDLTKKKYTVLKVAYYLQSRYSLKTNRTFVEWARKQSAYLRDILLHRDVELPFTVVEELTHGSHDIFIREVQDDMRGYLVEIERAPSTVPLLIVAAAGFGALTAYLFATSSPYGLSFASLAIEVITLAIIFVDAYGKRKE
jgi:hypothetical protein